MVVKQTNKQTLLYINSWTSLYCKMGILRDILEFFRGLLVDGVPRPLPEATYLWVKRCFFFGAIGLCTGVILIILTRQGVISDELFSFGYTLAIVSLVVALISGMMAYVGTDGLHQVSHADDVPPYSPRHSAVVSRSWYERFISAVTEPRTPPSTASSLNPENASTSSGRSIQVGEDIPLRNLQEPGSSTGAGASSSTEPAGEGTSSAEASTSVDKPKKKKKQ